MSSAFSCYALSWRNIATLAHTTQDVVRSPLTILLQSTITGRESRPITARLSVPGTYDLHVSFDVGVGSNPCLIPDQNAGTLTTDEQPQTMHVSEFLEQTKDSRDVVRVRRSQVVGSHAN